MEAPEHMSSAHLHMAILRRLGEIERRLSADAPDDEIDALIAQLRPLFTERRRRMH